MTPFQHFMPDKDMSGGVTPKEYQSIHPVLTNHIAEYEAGAYTVPFVIVVHCKPGEETESFLVFFTIPHVGKLIGDYRFEHIRISRMDTNAYLDWYTVAKHLLEQNNFITCR